jgi:hypothetical protein
MEHQRSHAGMEWQNIVEGCESEDDFMGCTTNTRLLDIASLSSGKVVIRFQFVVS